jgi:hypothetical protein
MREFCEKKNIMVSDFPYMLNRKDEVLIRKWADYNRSSSNRTRKYIKLFVHFVCREWMSAVNVISQLTC